MKIALIGSDVTFGLNFRPTVNGMSFESHKIIERQIAIDLHGSRLEAKES